MSRTHIAVVVALATIGIVVAASALDRPYFGQAWGQEPSASDSASQAANRGAFSLVDHTGRAVTDEDFLGRFILVFFGYTYCPDVCPTDLQVMSSALEILGPAGERVQPIFITIDPERDTTEVLASYVGHFHPRLVGLTGTPEQVAAIAKIYRVRYRKFYPLVLDEDDEGGGGTSGEEDNSQYLIDHTGATYLIGPDGGGLSLFHHGITPEEMAADIRRFLPKG
jgi:protein SCO1/2